MMYKMTGMEPPRTDQPQPKEPVPVPLRFVAVAGHANDWAMYKHWAHLTDDEIAKEGDKISYEEARHILMASMDPEPRLRGFLELDYRK